MTKATTRRFFFGGTVLFTLVFIGLTIHTHTTIASRTHADRLTEEVVRGLHVWAQNNCENCHTLLGEGAYYAPDLTQIMDQKGRSYLAEFLRDPSRFYSEERDGRLMPNLDLSDREIDDLLSFLDWVGDIDTNGWPPRPILVSGVAVRGRAGPDREPGADLVSQGRTIFDGIGACASCHAREPGVERVGPSLHAAAVQAAQRIEAPDYGGAARDAREYLRESILAPNAYIVGDKFLTPDGLSLMPTNYAASLDPDQVEALVAYLLSLEGREGS